MNESRLCLIFTITVFFVRNNKDSKVSRPCIEYIQTADLVNRVNMDWFYIVMFWLYLLNDIIVMFAQKK